MPSPIGMTLFEVANVDATTLRDSQGHPITSVKVFDQELTGEVSDTGTTHQLAGTDWSGTTLRGNLRCGDGYLPVDLRIKNASSAPATLRLGDHTPSTEFALQLKRPEDGHWINACQWPVGSSDNTAFPLLGYWDTDGNHVTDNTKFSFACFDNAIIKCLEDGYPAPQTDAKPPKEELLFQACTRMMRADYCGQGFSFTKDGNAVAPEDTSGIAQTSHSPPLTFEGAWTEDKMVCFHHQRTPAIGKPSCLHPNHLPKCATVEDAQKQFPSQPLLFNWSCADQSCATQVSKAR